MKSSLHNVTRLTAVFLLGTAALCSTVGAEPLESPLQDKVNAKLEVIKTWAANPAVVAAVKAHNTKLTADEAAMTQDKWKALTVLDPVVRAYAKNDAGVYLKSVKTDAVGEAFVSGSDGKKVAFLSKPSNWSHVGKPKHDDPMAGKTWQGSVEVDDSTGLKQVQVSVPVLEDGKAIGSLVVGLNLSKLD